MISDDSQCVQSLLYMSYMATLHNFHPGIEQALFVCLWITKSHRDLHRFSSEFCVTDLFLGRNFIFHTAKSSCNLLSSLLKWRWKLLKGLRDLWPGVLHLRRDAVIFVLAWVLHSGSWSFPSARRCLLLLAQKPWSIVKFAPDEIQTAVVWL